MVSLSLMARLVEAVRPEARLVLVGDPGQLASVEAGAVLGDIVGAGGRRRSSCSTTCTATAAGSPRSPTRSARGDGDAVIDALRAGHADVSWIEVDVADPARPTALAPVRDGRGRRRPRPSSTRRARATARAAIDALGAFRVLCAHRRGAHGVSVWTARIEGWLGRASLERGALVRGPPAAGHRERLRAAALQRRHRRRRRDGDGPRRARRSSAAARSCCSRPARLGAVETVYAMTMHKPRARSSAPPPSCCPPPTLAGPHPRAALHGGHARPAQLILAGTEETIRAAVARPVARASGLGPAPKVSGHDRGDGSHGRGRAPRRRAPGRGGRRAYSSCATRARARRADVRVASGYGALEEMREAFAGADTVFLIPAAEAADRVEQHTTAVDAAVAAGVPRLVYLSFLGAAPDATFTLARDHWATEEHIRATGLRWTFLRMNLYMDFIPRMVGVDGVIRGPAGDGRVSAILREDVAAAAAAVLPSDGHDGVTYDLTGPSSFSAWPRRRSCWAPASRTRPTSRPTPPARATARPDWEVRGWVTLLPGDPRRQPRRHQPVRARADRARADVTRRAPRRPVALPAEPRRRAVRRAAARSRRPAARGRRRRAAIAPSAAALGRVALCRAGLGLRGLFLAVLRRRVGRQVLEQPGRGGGDLLDRAIERGLVGL